MNDHTFCRLHLKEVMKDVRKVTTAEERKRFWAYKYQHGSTGEFQGPDRFYWSGRVCCAWEARAKGWTSWMEEKGHE